MLFDEASAREYYKLSNRIKRFFGLVLCTFGFHRMDTTITVWADIENCTEYNFESRTISCSRCDHTVVKKPVPWSMQSFYGH